MNDSRILYILNVISLSWSTFQKLHHKTKQTKQTDTSSPLGSVLPHTHWWGKALLQSANFCKGCKRRAKILLNVEIKNVCWGSTQLIDWRENSSSIWSGQYHVSAKACRLVSYTVHRNKPAPCSSSVTSSVSVPHTCFLNREIVQQGRNTSQVMSITHYNCDVVIVAITTEDTKHQSSVGRTLWKDLHPGVTSALPSAHQTWSIYLSNNNN